MKNLKVLIVVIAVMILSFTTGCLFRSSSNPAASEVAQSQQLAQTVAQPQAKVMASAFSKPAGRTYTYSKCGHNINNQFRQNVRRLAGSLKVCLLGADSTEEILISFEKMKVKPDNGSPLRVNIDESTINLLDAAQLSGVLADAQLPEGVYKYMEFYVKDAHVKVNGETKNMVVPSRKVRFFGKFEIKEGYTTVLAIKFLHRIIKWKIFGKQFYMLIPIVKISSTLELKPVDPAITDGDVNGHVESFVDAGKLSGATVSLDGTSFSALTAADGTFSFPAVPAGLYTLRAIHPDFLDYSFQVEVVAGQVSTVVAQLNPAVIRSNISNTGWFSEFFPYADANGTYAEVSMETPIKIDFVSLAFTKAEVKFTGLYSSVGAARFNTFMGVSQQVSAETDLGSWWVGYNATLSNPLGLYYASEAGNEYTVDVTEMIRSNPSSAYFLAAQNLDFADIKLTNIQLSIYYR
ncbi:MAG: carboxypeptidase-like regulatory domain-containing protein [Candidatus Riflebacteria bacterium]